MGANMPQKALSDQTISAMLSQWGNIAKYHEAGSVHLYGQSMLLFRYRDLVSDQALVNTYFQGHVPVLVDAEAEAVEDPVDLETVFARHEAGGKKPRVYFLWNIDRFLLEKNRAIFSYLTRRYVERPSVSYLLFFKIDFSHPMFVPTISGLSAVEENAIVHPLASQEDCTQFLRHLLGKWNLTVEDHMQKEILQRCNRMFWLIKEAVRYLRDTKGAKRSDVFAHEAMRSRLTHMFASLLPSEQTAIKKVVLGKNDFTPDEMHSIAFLKQTGLDRRAA